MEKANLTPNPISTFTCNAHDFHASKAGFTLSEILISLVVLSVGLVFLSSMIPVTLKQTDVARQNSTCQAIALNYFGMIKSLPYNFSQDDLRNCLHENLNYIQLAESELPKIREISVVETAYCFPKDEEYVFHDRTVSSGEYLVDIAFLPATAGKVDGRLLRICVRKIGGDWKMFTFIRTKTYE